MNLTTGENIWTLGGPDGMFAIRDEDNVEWPAGSSLWVGQHNAEFFGEDEYCMFDNQYNTGNNSRMLCVVLDEERGAAHLSWEKKLDASSPHFGDNDRLPTGNHLGCYWPDDLYSDEASHDQYDEIALEIVRDDNTVAWQLGISGPECSASSCEKDLDDGVGGWNFYSIEVTRPKHQVQTKRAQN